MTVKKLANGTYEASIQGASKLHTFEFQKWGAEEATDTLLDLIGIGGDAAGSLLSLVMGGGLDADLGSSPIEALFRQLAQGLTRDKRATKQLLMKLSSDRVICDGVTVAYKEFYADALPLSFQVAKANLEVQYGNFFDAAKSLGLLKPQSEADKQA